MLKSTGECKCGLERKIECDDPGIMQRLKNMPCHHCSGMIKYKPEKQDHP